MWDVAGVEGSSDETFCPATLERVWPKAGSSCAISSKSFFMVGGYCLSTAIGEACTSVLHQSRPTHGQSFAKEAGEISAWPEQPAVRHAAELAS